MRCESCVWATKTTDKKIFCMIPQGKCLDSYGKPRVKTKLDNKQKLNKDETQRS